MKDQMKTKKQLIDELMELRQQITELEALKKERKGADAALKESEEKFRELFDNAPVGYHELDIEGRITRVNRTELSMLGYTTQEMLGRPIWKFIMEEEKSRQSVTDKLAGRIPLSKFLKRTFRRKDEMPVLVSIEEKLLKDNEGKIIGIQSTIQDITEHNRMEEALRQSEGRYRTLVEESFDGIFVQKENKIIFANKRLYEMLGYDKGQLEGLDHWLVYHPDYQNLTRERAQARMRGEEVPSQYQVKLQRKDGSSFDGEINARKIMFGNDPGIQVWVRDITDRKQAEEALRQSEEKYRAILENIEDGYYEVDLTGNLTFFNDSLCRMLGYSKGELIGMGNQQYTDQENRKKLFEAFNRVYRTGEPTKGFDWEVIRKDGAKVFGEVSVSLLKDSKGQPIGFRGIARDITERKQAEEKINHTLSLLNATMESTADGILVVDKDGKIASLNQRFVRMWRIPESIIASRDDGLALEYVLGQLKAPQDFLAKVRELYSQPEADSFDTLEFIDGRVFERYSQPQRLGDQIVGRVWSFRDVTERKDAEAQMIESEERYRTAIEHSNDGVTIVRGGEHLYVNKRFVEIFGYDRPEEIIGKQHSITVHPDDLGKVMKFNTRRQRGESVPERYEFKGIRKDGTVIYIEVSATQTTYRGESVSLAYLRDITERKQAEEALRESEDRYRDLVEFSQYLICTHDLKGQILSINQGAAKLLGYDKSFILGKNLRDFLAPEVRGEFGTYLSTIQEQDVAKGLMLIQTATGEKRFWEYNNTLRMEGIAEPIVRGMAHDITEARQAEEEKEKLILELQNTIRKVKTLSGMLPICASCKKIRDDKGYWNQIESYIRDHSEVEFSHGICPECVKKLYPDEALD